jgi:hypothetical protein
MSAQKISAAVAESWPYEAARPAKPPPTSARGSNPYLILAALLGVLAISWAPIALVLIWLV